MTIHDCPAPGCHWSTHGDPDSLRCIRKGCPGAAGVHVKANRALGTHLFSCLVGEDPKAIASAWRARAEVLAELADAHERSLADATSALSKLADQVLAIHEIVASKVS